MNEELLDTLVSALRMSPDNHVLRKQVVQGMLELRRWSEIDDCAQPLQQTEHQAFALYAMARAALALDDMARADELYHQATRLDPELIDEQLEATLKPEDRIRIAADDEQMGPPRFQPYNGPRVKFGDVGGMDDLKEQIRLNILYPFQHPELYAAYGKKVGGGILMYGPPGCGKTHIARATAGELGASFYFLELSEILDMWMGETERHLNELFDTARADTPAVIFIDEIDAIGAKRSEIRSPQIRWSVTQLLTEMDGISSSNDELLVMGATNAPWDVDQAFRRPGRFDRVLFVPPPDSRARVDILKLHTRGRKIDPNIQWEAVAAGCEHYSGADIASLVDRACELALGEAIRLGKMRDVSVADFRRVIKDMRPSTVEWLRRAKNYVTYANQDGFYNELSQYIAHAKI